MNCVQENVHEPHTFMELGMVGPAKCPGLRPDGYQEVDQRMQEIRNWWVELAMVDADTTVPKAIQYGAADLDIMGEAMWALVRDKFEATGDEVYLPETIDGQQIGREMACAFYLLGKVARMYGAYEQGKLPSEDTLFDTAVYAMMIRRIRTTGRWV